MEKTGNSTVTKFHARLLNILCSRKNYHNVFCGFFFFALFFSVTGISFARTPTANEIRALTVRPTAEYCFTAQENGYILNIPGIEPSRVQADLDTLPLGVQFISLKKDEFIGTTGERGTSIQLWFTFTDTGRIRMPPLIVRIGLRTYRIPFAETTVYENPSVIVPSIEINFKKGAERLRTAANGVERYTTHAGTEILFSLNLKYFVNVINFSWVLPKNSIFKELERSRFLEGEARTREFSADSVPLADFSWTPLVPGTYSLPEFTISATSYNGSRRTIISPAMEITVLPESENALSEEDSLFNVKTNIYSSSFSEIPEGRDSSRTETDDSRQIQSGTQANSNSISRADCEKLAELRSNEKSSLPWSKMAKERREFEISLGILDSQNESSVYALVFFSFLTVIMLIFLTTLIILKKRKLFFATGFLSVILLGFVLWSAATISPRHAIFCGGTLSPVPEENTYTKTQLSAGVRVKIEETAGDWVFIRFMDFSGWTTKEKLIEIQ